jgi:membrane fusion protein
VQIRYDAFPYQKYGVFDGEVEYVARTTTLPGDKSFPLPVTEAVYLARVSGLSQSVAGGRAQQSLQPGMTLTADIRRDRRRIVEWLFEPLISAGQRL